MDEIGLSSGVPTFIEEINTHRGNMVGSSICITGKLIDHDVSKCLATLMDPSNKLEVNIDTSLIEPFEAKLGSLFQMIGELEVADTDGNGIVLKTRVVRSVDGMDMAMYRKAIECQRMYLSKRNG